MNAELALVLVALVRSVPADPVALVVGAHELAELFALDVTGRDVEIFHYVIEGVPFVLSFAQEVVDVGEAREDMLAGACVLRLRVDDRGRSIGRTLALAASGRGRGCG